MIIDSVTVPTMIDALMAKLVISFIVISLLYVLVS